MAKWEVWGIRHKPTGWWMPQASVASTRGASHVDPAPDVRPRLFHSKRAAINAITAYCMGKWKNKTPYGDDEPYIDVEKVRGRNREDFEAVKLVVTDAVVG